jgi:hypothetical protein
MEKHLEKILKKTMPTPHRMTKRKMGMKILQKNRPSTLKSIKTQNRNGSLK